MAILPSQRLPRMLSHLRDVAVVTRYLPRQSPCPPMAVARGKIVAKVHVAPRDARQGTRDLAPSRTYQMISLYLAGWVELAEVTVHLAKLKPATL